jgi:RNA polymerase sigma factor (sigma-70 family)
VALRVVGNRNWAEDALQEAYLNIWRIAGDYRANISPPMAWMGVIVRSRALDFLRRRTSERADAALELDDAISETVAGDSPNPMDTTQASEQAWALHECLRKLEAKQREVVSLAYLRDLSHGELSEQLKLPLGTVKTWIRRGWNSCAAAWRVLPEPPARKTFMNIINNPNLLDQLAASYALGTLRGGARRRFETLARQSATVRASALIWQERIRVHDRAAGRRRAQPQCLEAH